MSPVLSWPDQVPGPPHCFNKNRLTNLSKLPQPILRTWEFHFSIPPWLLEVFGLVPGVFLEVEIFICRDQPDREDDSIVISIWLNWVIDLTDGDQPHFIKSSDLNFGFSWPNSNHVSDKEYHRNLRTTLISEGSDDTFANSDWSPGSDTPAPQYNSLSPHPPRFQSAEEEQQENDTDHINSAVWSVTERICQAHSIAEELANTLYWVHMSQGTDLDQFAFREGRLTYCQLQHLDCINHPDLYNEATETPVAGPLSQFQEDDQNQEGEEPEEHWEEEQEPLQHPPCTPELTQQEDSCNETQSSEESSQASNSTSEITVQPIETLIVQFLNEEDWTLWLNGQLDRIFQ